VKPDHVALTKYFRKDASPDSGDQQQGVVSCSETLGCWARILKMESRFTDLGTLLHSNFHEDVEVCSFKEGIEMLYCCQNELR